MKEWRERRGPGTLTDFVDPDTANNTPARKRGRILAVAKAKQNERIAAALAARNLANNSLVDNSLVDISLIDNDSAGTGTVTGAVTAVRRTGVRVDNGHLTRSLETRVFGTGAPDADDAENVGGDETKYLMQPPPTPAAVQGPASDDKPSPSPGDILFLQQCDQFRVEEGNDVAEEPPRMRRAPRRSKAEMDKVRADKEAARIKREEERARKQAALKAKTDTPAVKKEKEQKVDNVVNLITPPRPAPAASTPAALTEVVEIMDDYDPNLLYQMPRSLVNNPQTMAAPTFDSRGSITASPSVRSTPAPDFYGGFTQGYNTTMNYPTPSRNGSTPLPSFQANFGMEPTVPQRSNYGYPIRQNNSFNGYSMMGQYQPMNFNFGMQQNGYMQSGMPNPHQQNTYSMNQDPMFNLPPIYGNTSQTSDARVLFGDSPVAQSTTEPQPAAPLAPMDIIPTIETDNGHAGPSKDKAT